MKLRLKGSSLRLRVTRSELVRLKEGDRIQETVVFPTVPPSSLSYVLEVALQSDPIQAAFTTNQIVVSVSQDQLVSWSGEHQVGVYAFLTVTDDTGLDVAIEKDFACLDLSDEDNKDTFANPLAGKVC